MPGNQEIGSKIDYRKAAVALARSIAAVAGNSFDESSAATFQKMTEQAAKKYVQALGKNARIVNGNT